MSDAVAGTDISARDSAQVTELGEAGHPCDQCASHAHCLGSYLATHSVTRTTQPFKDHHTLRNREHIFRQGDKADALYIVKSGSAKLYFVSEDGGEQVVAFYMPGEVLGLDALGVETYKSSAMALERTSLCVVPVANIARVIENTHCLYKLLSRELVRDHHTIELIAKKDADAKMASFLIDMSQRFHNRGYSASSFNLSMKRSEIGSHLGLAIETVSRILTRFQEDGLLRVERRKVEILDLTRLGHLAGIYTERDRAAM